MTTPEEFEARLKRKRDKWNRAKTRRRKQARDTRWLQHGGDRWVAKLEVLHSGHLLKCLIDAGHLKCGDHRAQARIDEGIDRLFRYYSTAVTRSYSGPDEALQNLVWHHGGQHHLSSVDRRGSVLSSVVRPTGTMSGGPN